MEDEKQVAEQSKAVSIYRELSPAVWDMITSVAPVAHMARIFGVANEQQAAMIMLKGHELGLGLTASFEFIQIVEGKPALSPRGALALILRSPLYAGVRIENLKDQAGKPKSCRVWMKRTNGFEYTEEWSMEDAKAAGVVKAGSGWEKYPANMLRWRATGFCADVVFPDIMGGMKRADEFGADITPEGDVIEGSWRETTKPPAAGSSASKQSEPVVTLAQLTEQYGAEAILAANEGKIPGTNEDLAACAEKLAAAND